MTKPSQIGEPLVSLIIPTYNESDNIVALIESIKENLPSAVFTEIVVVDDNSPDGTGKIMEDYVNAAKIIGDDNDIKCIIKKNCVVKVIHRNRKVGLVPAILNGIECSTGDYILVMDADFSHSPKLIPKIVYELENPDIDIVVASRYIKGGSIVGWPLKRRLISKGAMKIAKYGLPIKNEVTDPMSGFFAFKRHVIRHITIDSAGYKILLEILVKASDARVKEIPYTFTDRKEGKSKLDYAVILDYIRALYHLYRYGQKSNRAKSKQTTIEKRKSVLFLSKAGRFYTVGASGLLLNYLVSVLLANSALASIGYLQATVVGIIVSNISNFFLNKFWTFEDKDFSLRKTLRQYGLFAGITSGGATVQLASLYLFVESGLEYETSLITAVAISSVSNFLLNKKWTFGEKTWG